MNTELCDDDGDDRQHQQRDGKLPMTVTNARLVRRTEEDFREGKLERRNRFSWQSVKLCAAFFCLCCFSLAKVRQSSTQARSGSGFQGFILIALEGRRSFFCGSEDSSASF